MSKLRILYFSKLKNKNNFYKFSLDNDENNEGYDNNTNNNNDKTKSAEAKH